MLLFRPGQPPFEILVLFLSELSPSSDISLFIVIFSKLPVRGKSISELFLLSYLTLYSFLPNDGARRRLQIFPDYGGRQKQVSSSTSVNRCDLLDPRGSIPRLKRWWRDPWWVYFHFPRWYHLEGPDRLSDEQAEYIKEMERKEIGQFHVTPVKTPSRVSFIFF